MRTGLNRKIVIVGAGITGLTAAHQLLRSGYDGQISICESNSHSSGRLESVRIPNSDDVIELGAGRFHIQRHAALNRLRLELGLEIQPFNFPASYGGMTNQSTYDGTKEFSRLLAPLEKNLPDAQEMKFPDLATSVLGKEGLSRLVALTGYDTLANPSLPVPGGMSILKDHPEGQSYLTGETEQWYSMKGGFQCLLEELEQSLIGKVELRYNTIVKSIAPLMQGYGYELCVCIDGLEKAIVCDAIILATPLHKAFRISGLDRFAGLDGRESVEDIPLIKGFCRFSNPWWRKEVAGGCCVINSTPLRKVYLSDCGNLIWFYCDGESALRTARILRADQSAITGLLEDHLGCGIPSDALLEDFTWKFWRQGISFLKFNTAGEDKFRKLSDDVVVCSDIYTEHVGWIEGGLLSAQAGSAQLAHLM
jgi:hypothetical protein